MHKGAPFRRVDRAFLVGLIALAASCAIWQALVLLTGAQRFPSFTATLAALFAQLPTLASEAAITIARAAIGLAMAAVVMIPLGVFVARTLRLTRLERLALIDLRAASPRIVSGVRLGLAASLLIAISTEMLLSADGLGSYIVRAQESFRIADGMAALLFIAFLSLAINGAAGWLDHRLLEWNYLRRASGDS